MVTEGYILLLRHERPKSPNCHDATQRDYHVWLGTSPGTLASRAHAMIVELAPRVVARHPRWGTEATILALAGAHVRISGWLMLDQEHPEQVGRTRGDFVGNPSGDEDRHGPRWPLEQPGHGAPGHRDRDGRCSRAHHTGGQVDRCAPLDRHAAGRRHRAAQSNVVRDRDDGGGCDHTGRAVQRPHGLRIGHAIDELRATDDANCRRTQDCVVDVALWIAHRGAGANDRDLHVERQAEHRERGGCGREVGATFPPLSCASGLVVASP